MTGGEAVALVADSVSGYMWSCEPQELVAGFESLPEPDQERVLAAIEVVSLRLGRMGTRRG